MNTKPFAAVLTNSLGQRFMIGFFAETSSLAREHASMLARELDGGKVVKVGETDMDEKEMGLFISLP